MERRRATARVLLTLTLPTLVGALVAGSVHGAPGERIETLAGAGGDLAGGGLAGDGGPARSALLTDPSAVATLPGGGFLIADAGNNRIRRVDGAGTITTVAGAGPCCGATGSFAGDGTLAVSADVRLNRPRGVSALPGGGLLIADTGNNRIRKVVGGVITTVAGNGTPGFSGDGGPAIDASLNAPGDVAALPDGGFLIADTGNDRIRHVDSRGRITTVAGGRRVSAPSGDGGPATAAALAAPARVVPLPGGGFLIADTGYHRIRRVDVDNTIRTVAGTGTAGYAGDGGPAGRAQLNAPEGVATLADGSIVIADTGNERVRLVGPDGKIRTLAGDGTAGFSGDGGDPEAARLSRPRAVAASGSQVLISDGLNNRVRGVMGIPLATGPGEEPMNPAPPLGVSSPLLGRRVVAKPRLGRVLVRLPGTARFVALESISNLPMGAELDVADGSVVLFFTTDEMGRRAKAIVTGGRFVLNQPAKRDRGQRPGELVLSGPLHGCQASPRQQVRGQRSARRGPLAGAAKRAKHGRRLKVRARGRIRTRGRYGAATVRGTRWTMTDRCPTHPRPGTLVVVSKGKVAVQSFALRRTVLVRAGRRFLAPARR